MTKIILKLTSMAALTSILFSLCSCDMMGTEPNTSDSGMLGTPMVTLPAGESTATIGSDQITEAPLAPLETMLEDMGDGIKDFAEGTVVDIESVPEVVKAVTDKYPKSTVTGITHATHLGKQVYEVKYTDENGTTRTAYVSPDGKTVTDAVEPEATGSPAPTGSPTQQG